VKKMYDRAKTPYPRVLDSPFVDEEAKEQLRKTYLRLNPVKLRTRMVANLEKLWKLEG